MLLTGCFHKKQVAQNQPVAPPIEDTTPPRPEPANTATAGGFNPGAVAATADYASIGAGKEACKAQEACESEYASGFEHDAAGLGCRKPDDKRPAESAAVHRRVDSADGEKPDGISRQLNYQEQKTAAQIREYIKHAREALTAGDVDGASNLATKAKLLLDELHP